MVFESDVVPEDWRSTVTVQLYKGKGKKRKDRKRGKIGVKRKWWVLAQSPYSSQGSGR